MDKIELIDRAAVLERLEKYRDMPLDNHTFRGAKIPPMLLEMRQAVFCDVEQLLRAAPTITPEPVRGEWKYRNYRHEPRVYITGWYACTRCNSGIERIEGMRAPNFCPNCGADMRGETHGAD